MSYRRPLLVLSALSGLLSACGSEPPYVTTDYRYAQRGVVQICYAPGTVTPEQLRAKANAVCKTHDREAKFVMQQAYQCSWTAPTLATFLCLARPGENPPPPIKKNSPMRHDDTID